MYNIGIDLVEIKRIKESVDKGNFIDRYFSKEEQQLFYKSNGEINYERVAGNFSSKEAFSKAMKTGVSGFKLVEVSILRDKNNAPYIKLSGKAEELFKDKFNFDVSMTHTKEYAQAVVIAEQK